MFNLIEFLYLRQKNNLVYYDSVTGVKSRAYFERVLKRKYLNKKCKVIYVDINDLKLVNDIQGHPAGTEYIKSIAKQLQKLKPLDVCRVGGDEFLVIVDVNFNILDLSTVKGISYGYYIKGCNEDLTYALKMADREMYNMKKEYHLGRGVI